MKKRILLVAALGIVAVEPILFWDVFAGDAEVHLVFMYSASSGRFFEFNPGEAVSGETSPGYMMLGAALFKVMGPAAMPVALKTVNLVAWFALCWLVFRTAKRFLSDDDVSRGEEWPAVAAFLAATLVGSVYNANVGMENGLFAVVIWGWILLADRRRWFEGARESQAREALGALLLGLSIWLRPEGWAVAIAAYAFRLTRPRGRALHLLPGATIVLVIGGAATAFQHFFTGDFVATSILSRRVLAMRDLIGLGPIRLDPRFAERLLVYLPLTAAFLWGLRPTAGPHKPTERFLQILFGVFFVLYTLTGAPQLSRYLIFLMPILIIGAIRGAKAAWRNERFRGVLLAGGLLIVAVDLIELRYRRHHITPELLQDAATAMAKRRERTDRLLAALENPTRRPLVVATEAVQIRYQVDDRIIVRSLDGRVDRTLLAFVKKDSVDHIGYLKALHADYLLQTISYNRASTAWSLTDLRGLKPGEALQRDGISFRRLAGHPYYALGASAELDDR